MQREIVNVNYKGNVEITQTLFYDNDILLKIIDSTITYDSEDRRIKSEYYIYEDPEEIEIYKALTPNLE